MHNNKRIYGYDSPSSLALRDQDCVVVAPHDAPLPLPDVTIVGDSPMEE